MLQQSDYTLEETTKPHRPTAAKFRRSPHSTFSNAVARTRKLQQRPRHGEQLWRRQCTPTPQTSIEDEQLLHNLISGESPSYPQQPFPGQPEDPVPLNQSWSDCRSFRELCNRTTPNYIFTSPSPSPPLNKASIPIITVTNTDQPSLNHHSPHPMDHRHIALSLPELLEAEQRLPKLTTPSKLATPPSRRHPKSSHQLHRVPSTKLPPLPSPLPVHQRARSFSDGSISKLPKLPSQQDYLLL